MNETTKRCDICGQGTVCWPGIFTVLGPRDMCGICYWHYRELLEQLEAFFKAEHV